MKVFITGVSGMMGRNLASMMLPSFVVLGNIHENDVSFLDKKTKINLMSESDMFSFINREKPDVIVHCAALTNVDKCESDFTQCLETNYTITRKLVSCGRDCKFIYISTDSVFDGRNGLYSEDSPTFAVNNYSYTKLLSEDCVSKLENYIIIRTNFFGYHYGGCNLATWIIDSLKNDRKIKMFTDVIFSPLFVNTLSELVIKLLEIDFNGIIHLGSSDSISKFEFGLEIASHFGLKSSLIEPVIISDFNLISTRPKNTSLNVSKMKNVLGASFFVKDEIRKISGV